MLVINRKVGESILIGKHGDIVIKVLPGYSDGVHRIGIDAPREIPIKCGEDFSRTANSSLGFLANDDNKDDDKTPTSEGHSK